MQLSRPLYVIILSCSSKSRLISLSREQQASLLLMIIIFSCTLVDLHSKFQRNPDNWSSIFQKLWLCTNPLDEEIEEQQSVEKSGVGTCFRAASVEKVAFPSLEVLELEFLDTLEGLAQDPLPVGSLCKLRKINVVNCDELVNVVPSKLLARLRNLEELTVEDCRSVEKVFDLERLDIKEGDSDMLSQLKSVKLISLPKLNHISKRDLIGFMYIPRLSTLHVHDCNSLMYLFSPAMMKSIPQLRELEIRRCKMMSGIVAESNGKGESSVHKIEFPQLKLLRLYDLSNLVSFFPKVIDTVVATNGSLQNSLQPLFNEKVAFPILEELELGGLQNTNDIWCSQLLPGSFHKLKLMCVSNCGSLRSLFSPFMARYLVNLQKLIILTMEEAVAKEEDEVRGTGKIYKTLFPQLNHLELRGLPKLGSFCHVTHDWELPLVEYVHTHNCPELKTYSPGFLRSSNIQLGSGEESAQMDHFKNTLQYFSGKQQQEEKEDGEDEEGMKREKKKEKKKKNKYRGMMGEPEPAL